MCLEEVTTDKSHAMGDVIETNVMPTKHSNGFSRLRVEAVVVYGKHLKFGGVANLKREFFPFTFMAGAVNYA